MSRTRVAFAGLGAIGRPMAARLTDRYDVAVWNRTAAVATEFARSHGATAAASPRELAAGAAAVFTCLPSSHEVAALLDGPEGLAAGLEPGAMLIDCTSGDPVTTGAIARKLEENGVAFVDAPVTGGVAGAEAGTLTAMVGGSPQAFALAESYLSAFAKTIIHVGPTGSGHALKAVSNAILAANILALADGLTALVKAGVPAATAVSVLNASNARSLASQQLIPERVLTGAYPKTFRLALLDKDARNAVDVFDAAHVPAPLLRRVSELLGNARAELGESADHVEVVRMAERLAGVEVRG